LNTSGVTVISMTNLSNNQRYAMNGDLESV